MTTPVNEVVREDVSPPTVQLASGGVFASLLADGTEQRAAALEALLDRVVDERTRVAWVGNPLRSPLTIERFLIQIVGPEIDLRVERGPAELARVVARPVGHEARLLIVVQQPETINAEMRDLLGAMAGHLRGVALPVQFLFVGSTSFVPPKVAPIRLAPPMAYGIESEATTNANRRRDVLPLLLLLLAVTLGVVVSMWPRSADDVPHAALDVATAAQAAPWKSGSTAVPPSSPAPTDVAALRREFDTFLAQRASSLPPLSESQRDALFNEFLTHHYRE